MSELVPIPLPLLLRRAFYEYQREGKIFDLPAAKFYRGMEGLNLSVDFHGHRAATPLGPAAGPHGQLAQNIALSWLGGSRVIELKTVQILDELKIPRPCIDAANVGYNVEWSQELTLEQSLREYVKAAMFLEILKASNLLGTGIPAETVFDMSVGYNLDGIRSARVRGWIESMKDARAIIDELRADLAGEWAHYRDLEYPTCISDTVSLSTFHGCPAGEIEGIATFLLRELDCHLCVKLNPTLLGHAEVEHLLHDVLGYTEIQLHPPAFDNDLRFDQALDLIPRLQQIARGCGRSFSVKVCNTLVVKNHKGVFRDELMYMSGAPLHPVAMTLAGKLRDRLGDAVSMSFSGGLDAHNMAASVAMGFVPVTTCTDLLRPGGYSRIVRYLENLGAEMQSLGVTTIPEFVAKYRGGDKHALVAEAVADPRYRWERNHGLPRKVGSKLWIYDCLNCDKCLPVCPNDANFVYQTEPAVIEYDNYELLPGRIKRVPGGVLRVAKTHQLANYADACNDCGNCDVFCPENGGPNQAKPRFHGSLESYDNSTGALDFFVAQDRIHGTFDGRRYILSVNRDMDLARFETVAAEVAIRWSEDQPLNWLPKAGVEHVRLDMLPYFKLKLLLESIDNPHRVNFANAMRVPETLV